jgi:hypothetical protein
LEPEKFNESGKGAPILSRFPLYGLKHAGFQKDVQSVFQSGQTERLEYFRQRLHEKRYAKRQQALPQGERLSGSSTQELPCTTRCSFLKKLSSHLTTRSLLLGGRADASDARTVTGQDGTGALLAVGW